MEHIKALLDEGWGWIVAIGAVLATVAAFLKNADDIKKRWDGIWQKRRERKEAAAKTLEAVKALTLDIKRIDGTLANMVTKINTVESQTSKAENAIRAIKDQNQQQSAQIGELSEAVRQIDLDTGDLLCSQITRDYEYYRGLGYCPDSDKRRMEDTYKRYHARGRNHVSESYLMELEALPRVKQ